MRRPDIGTASPLSNDATILSYPGPPGSNPVPDRAATARLDAIARRANRAIVVDIPVGVGFCMYLRRDCLDAVGSVPRRHVRPGLRRGERFLPARPASGLAPRRGARRLRGASRRRVVRPGRPGTCRRATTKLLNRLHPGYDRLIAAFAAADPLAEARRRLRPGALAGRRPGGATGIGHPGDPRRRRRRGASGHALPPRAYRAAGLRPIVLRPARSEPDDDAGDRWRSTARRPGFPTCASRCRGRLPALLRAVAQRPTRAPSRCITRCTIRRRFTT